mmetsp:Transcript_5255/g.11927  ORF Transcript_5255/g.11927 Transcript_5255/m.11927 type:complete len:1039 (+) Transcript_5255:164-3280(+)|eukprot:CAMPEP_0172301542 /NCGR_PEP_ID=MMETSP1058-20130122/3401_1 /TAXON_ID=83371 /ORGANISM="Detonula confervacea, Strain CCMP 353" /LENGTH=1038 /DNA_ID=CAMNT_0013011687 /DNA_START=107 /DNA_END=3223 /DNA_ORIENTATION=+
MNDPNDDENLTEDPSDRSDDKQDIGIDDKNDDASDSHNSQTNSGPCDSINSPPMTPNDDEILTDDPSADTTPGEPLRTSVGNSTHGSLRSSYGDVSVHSDRTQDYYDENDDCLTDDGGVVVSDNESNHGSGNDSDDSDDSGDASSIHSLQSCEIIGVYTQEKSSGGDGDNISHIESYYDEDHSYYSDNGSDDDSILIDDDSLSLGFPPGHYTRLDELNELQNHDNGTNDDNHHRSAVNPSIIPSYFFCPITKMIMIDPVITPDGHTFERRAMLRSLILESCDPISKNPLSHEELVEDYLVKKSIDKARKEAWIRYVVEFEDEEVDRIIVEQQQEKVMKVEGMEIMERDKTSVKTEDSFDEEEGVPSIKRKAQEQAPPPSPTPQEEPRAHENKNINQYDIPSNLSHDLHSVPSATSSTTVDTSSGNHGWSVPLGVHKVICSKPGLVVTADVHRRSNVVKRKIIKKSLVDNDKNKNVDANGKKKTSSKKKMKIKRRKKKKHKNLKTTTSVITRDLILPPGSHVDILETRVHGGRVRGRIAWEEEVATEMDRELTLLLEEEEVRKRAMARPHKSRSKGPKKGKARTFFRRLSGTRGQQDDKLPFTSELFDSRPPQHRSPSGKAARSPSPLTTIKYNGWISLQWASVKNHERDEALKRRQSDTGNNPKVSLVADEDEGPWSQQLPLGVYQISSSGDTSTGDHTVNAKNQDAGSSVKQLPLYDAPDSESNIVDFLVCNQCLEIVETQVLVTKRRDRDPKMGSMNNYLSNTEGKQVVRARCMVPVVVSPLSAEQFVGGNEFTPSKPQRKFRSGWITLGDDKNSTDVTASPIPVGAYVVTTDDPLMSCDGNSKIKSILPSGSCMEVVTTRVEFEEDTKMMNCRCCDREGMYYTVAVRALIASGGYVTLFVASMGTSGTHGSLCVCGQLVPHVVYAEPVPLGKYRVTQPVCLTQDSGHKSPMITQLNENACVQVIETRVEDGRVRGRVKIIDFANGDDDQIRKESTTGWVSLSSLRCLGGRSLGLRKQHSSKRMESAASNLQAWHF